MFIWDLCFTSDRLGCYSVSELLLLKQSSCLLVLWANRVILEPGLPVRMIRLGWSVSELEVLVSECLSSFCCSVCVCECVLSDTRTATYCSLIVFAFQKAATVSVVVQWVSLSGFRVVAKATYLGGGDNSKSATFGVFFGSPKQDFITKQVSEWCQIMMDAVSLSKGDQLINEATISISKIS